jgi:FkbM family methyltransferase
MSDFIKFDDNKPDRIQETFGAMVDEVRSAYLYPPTKKGVCIDIGSNVGAFTYFVASNDMYEEVYAFEPSQETHRTSVAILGQLGALKKDVEVVNLAVTGKSGDKFFLHANPSGRSGDASLIEPEGGSTQKELVTTISLDDIIEKIGKDRIDFIKMDCEGAELDILYHCENLSKVSIIMAECHHGCEDSVGMHLIEKGFYATRLISVSDNDVKLPYVIAFNAKEMYLEDVEEYFHVIGDEVKTFGAANPEFRLKYDEAVQYWARQRLKEERNNAGEEE